MDDLETRLLDADDWGLWKLVRLRSLVESPEAFGSTYATEVSYGEADWRAWLTRDEPQVVVLRGTEPVAAGAAYVDSSGRLHVIAMWTDPAHRGRRLAARVLTALVEWAAPRDLELVLDVAIGNVAAVRSYEAFGFVRTGTTRPIRDGSTALVEELVLRRG